MISDDQLSVSMTSWGSVVLAHGGITSGRHEFKFVIAQKAPTGGLCVGVVDNAQFDATSKNVGAAPNSWGFSSSGKKVRRRVNHRHAAFPNRAPRARAPGSPRSSSMPTRTRRVTL